jgi:hypothetical protein
MKQMLRMPDNTDIQELEQETYRYSMQDGLAQILVGLILVTSAYVIENLNWYFYFFWLIVFAIPIWEKLRRKFTYPRIGYVKVRQDEPSRPGMAVLLFVMTNLVVVSLVMVLIPGDNPIYDTLWRYSPIVFGVMMILPSFFLVEKTGDRRYYALGILTVTTGLIVALLEFESPRAGPVLCLLGWGVAIILVGLTTFIRFIRRYPIIEPDEVEASEQC